MYGNQKDELSQVSSLWAYRFTCAVILLILSAAACGALMVAVLCDLDMFLTQMFLCIWGFFVAPAAGAYAMERAQDIWQKNNAMFL